MVVVLESATAQGLCPEAVHHCTRPFVGSNGFLEDNDSNGRAEEGE
jgi:hypothetical protein